MIGRFFKTIDLYGKLPKGLSEPTNSGAVVSVVTMVVLTLMVLTEIFVKIKIRVNIGMGIHRSKKRHFCG